MTKWAVQIANGKWLSRGRFDAAWDAAFELNHPELFDSQAEATDAAKGSPSPIVVPFTLHVSTESNGEEKP